MKGDLQSHEKKTYNCACPIPNGNCEPTKCLSVQEIAGFVENTNLDAEVSLFVPDRRCRRKRSHLRIVPETSSNDELDLLAYIPPVQYR